MSPKLRAYYLLLHELELAFGSLENSLVHEKLICSGIEADRANKLIKLIEKNHFSDGYRIDVLLFILKVASPSQFERLVVKERLGSVTENYEYDPVKNGQNIVKHGVGFSEVVSYSQRFGTLQVPCPDEHDEERIVLFSDLSPSRCKKNLQFSLPSIEEQAECYVISVAQFTNDRFRFISSRVMSRKKHKKTLNNALKNIYVDDKNAKKGLIERCLYILNRDLFKSA